MAKEIERKYTVRHLDMIDGRLGAVIVQGYLADEPMTIRVRIIDAEAFMTLKAKKVGIQSDEYEFPIPMHHARELLDKHCGSRIIEKTRYRVPHARHVVEVDVFSGRHSGLVIAEIELDHPEQEVDLPDWISSEITHDHRFSNSELSLASTAPSIDAPVP